VIAFETPVWAAADEPGHVQNIETLVRGQWYGINANCTVPPKDQYGLPLLTCNGDEAQQAPLYYLLMAGWQDLIGLPAHDPPQTLRALLLEGHRSGSSGFIRWLRIPNIFLGALTVVMAYLITRLITKDRWTPVIAAALVASFPHFVFLSAVVTNDNLVNLLGAVFAFCAIKILTQAFATRWMIAMGVTFGLLLTTKLSVLPLGLVIPIVAVMAQNWRHRISLFMYGIGSALFVSMWYLIQNWVRYGDPLARRASVAYLTRIGALGVGGSGIPYVVRDPVHLILADVPYRVFRDFWYQSGWGLVAGSMIMSAICACVVGAALLGLIGQHHPKKVLCLLGAISILAFSSVWLLAFQTGSYSARYAIVGVTAMACLLALALQRWQLVVRSLLPFAGLIGCIVAIQRDVLSVFNT
jgi:4-amino-4-deoxy-L-arabinose transferase-like glycosyltransferase